MILPADLSDPKIRNLVTSSLDLSRHPNISFPTAPVAPTTPTVYMDRDDDDEEVVFIDDDRRVEEERGDERLVTKVEEEEEGENPCADPGNDDRDRMAAVAARSNFIFR